MKGTACVFVFLVACGLLWLSGCAVPATPSGGSNPSTRPDGQSGQASSAASGTSSTPVATGAAAIVTSRPVPTGAVSVGRSEPASTVVLTALPQPTPLPPLDISGSPLPEVTLEDSGRTIEMRAGERFVLKLGEGYDWTVTVADPTVLSRVINVAVVRGAQGVYEAHKAGQTALDATGDPPCRKERPACGMPSRLFHVEVVVR